MTARTVQLGIGQDSHARMFWRFTPEPTDDTFWTLFDAIPPNAGGGAERVRDKVIARGTAAVVFSDLIKLHGRRLVDEGDTLPPEEERIAT